MNNAKNSTMKMRVPGAKQAIDKMKYEIANTVGGEITRRLVQNGMNQVSGSYNNK